MFREFLSRVGTTKFFLFIVFLIYVTVGFTDYALVEQSISAFVRLSLNILPVLVLVFVIMFFSNLILQADRTKKYLGEESGAKGWLVAIFGGILSTGPIYMWYPLLSDLKEKGMKNSLIAAFLYNRAVKIPLLPMMIYYFGWAFTIILTVYMILFSLVNGLIVGKIIKEKKKYEMPEVGKLE